MSDEESIGALVLEKDGDVVKDQTVPAAVDLSDVTLNGRPYIGDVVNYTNPNDMACGDWNYRRCGLCLMHEHINGKPADDCLIENKSAHKFFGIPEDQAIPKKVAGIEVGNFCPYWVDFRAE